MRSFTSPSNIRFPALPNVKLQHTRLGSRGEGLLSRRFRLDDVEFFAGGTVSTELDLTHTDAVMYYELLDNVVSLDLGGTLRVFNGHARAASRSRTLSESVDIDIAMPMAYGPGTNRAADGLCHQRDGERHWLQREFAPGSFRTNRLCIRLRRGRRSRAGVPPFCPEAGRRCANGCLPGRPLRGGSAPLLTMNRCFLVSVSPQLCPAIRVVLFSVNLLRWTDA